MEVQEFFSSPSILFFPSSPVTSTPEAEVPVNNGLINALRKENTDVKCLTDDWFKLYLSNTELSKKHLFETIFCAAGQFNYQYDDKQNFDEVKLKSFVMSKVNLHPDPPIFERCFVENFRNFLIEVFSLYEGKLLLEVHFTSKLINLVELLFFGKYDSYRIVAAHLGVKLMTYIYKLNKQIQIVQHSSNIPEYEEYIDLLTQYWNVLFKNLFKRGLRDVSIHVRKNILFEMLYWSQNSPELILNRQFHVHIYRALLHRNIYCKQLSYYILLHLLKVKIHLERQTELFNDVKSELINQLSGIGKFPALSMSIFNQVSSYIDLKLDKMQTELLYMAVYSKNAIVAKCATKIIYKTKLSFKNTNDQNEAVELLNDIILFNYEAYVSSEELLVDSFFWLLSKKTSWKDWKTIMEMVENEFAVSAASLLFAFVQKAVTNHNPKTRIKPCIRLSKDYCIVMAKDFTEYFKEIWFDIVELPQIKFQPQALVKVVQLIKFFTDEISPNIAFDMTQKLTKISLNAYDKHVIFSSSEMLVHLDNLLQRKGREAIQVKAIVNNFVDAVCSEYMNYLVLPNCTSNPAQIHSRMISILNLNNFNDQIIWDQTSTKLNCHYSEVCLRRDAELIRILINVLCSLLFSRFNQLINMNKLLMIHKNEHKKNHYEDEEEEEIDEEEKMLEDNICELEELILPRIYVVEQALLPFLVQDIDPSIKKQAFYMLVKLFENFGPHMVNHDYLNMTTMNFGNKFIEPIVKYVVNAMPQKSPKEDLGKPGECCSIITRFCSLFSNGLVNLLQLGCLLQLAGNNPVHDGILIKTLKKYDVKFSRHFKKVAKTIFHAVMVPIERSLSVGNPLNDAIKKGLEVAEQLVNTQDFKSVISRPAILHFHFLVIEQASKQKENKVLLKILTSFMYMLHIDDFSYIIRLLEEKKISQVQEALSYTSNLKSVSLTFRNKASKLRATLDDIPIQSSHSTQSDDSLHHDPGICDSQTNSDENPNCQ